MPARDETLKVSRLEKIIFSITAKELETKNNLRRYLAASADWRTLYADPTAIIYIRK
jgi:hypothetical protein